MREASQTYIGYPKKQYVLVKAWARLLTSTGQVVQPFAFSSIKTGPPSQPAGGNQWGMAAPLVLLALFGLAGTLPPILDSVDRKTAFES